MRPAWSGLLTIKTFIIPVDAIKATEDKRTQFHQVHATDAGPVRHELRCRTCGKHLQDHEHDIARAVLVKRRYVIVTKEDFDHIDTPSTNAIAIEGTSLMGNIPSLAMEQPYYLAPQSDCSTEAYTVLHRAMRHVHPDLVLVGRAMWRGHKEFPVAVIARDDGLLLWRLRWPDEVRVAPQHNGDKNLNLTRLTLAANLLAALPTIALGDMHDGTEEAIKQIVVRKDRNGSAEQRVTDLTTALQDSLRTLRVPRGASTPIKSGKESSDGPSGSTGS